MRKTKTEQTKTVSKKFRPALTPEARQQQMISLAVDLAEQQLRDGTASSQVITHYLKLGSSQNKLEEERMRLENEKIKAQTKSIAANENSEAMYKEAIAAFQRYSGNNFGIQYED